MSEAPGLVNDRMTNGKVRSRQWCRKKIQVVPANAGTHNHWPFLLQKPSTPAQKMRSRGVWVSAPVRNCALGGDDTGYVPHMTSIAPFTIASSSLRGTRARARIAMVWMVADASCASTTGSADAG